MFGVFVCVCVCCGALKKRGKNRVWIQKRSHVCIQNVPVCAGTTRVLNLCGGCGGCGADSVHDACLSMRANARASN